MKARFEDVHCTEQSGDPRWALLALLASGLFEVTVAYQAFMFFMN